MTTYQRDVGMTETALYHSQWDNVGQRKQQRGKKMFHAHPNGSGVGGRSLWGGSLRTGDIPLTDKPSSASSGHVPGYTGHIPQSREYIFKPEEIRNKNHQKDFFLLPDNYKQHKAGYTGNARANPEAYRDSMYLP